MERIICIIIGYIIGLFQTAYLYGRINHIDIRQHGSGNAGTTNIARTLGKKAGIITYFGDTFKSVVSAVIIHLLFGKTNSNMEFLLVIYGGLGVVLGHNFPFYLKFKGGKGIAATSGVALSLLPYSWIFPVSGFLTFTLGSIFTKYVSMGSLIFVTSFLIEVIILGQYGYFGMSSNFLYEAYAIVFAITLLAYIRHIANIKRLLNGTERKIGQKKENMWIEVI